LGGGISGMTVGYPLKSGTRLVPVPNCKGRKFDLIFADTLSGKVSRLEEALAPLQLGGIYIIEMIRSRSNFGPQATRRKFQY
jgi:hypothetical protein